MNLACATVGVPVFAGMAAFSATLCCCLPLDYVRIWLAMDAQAKIISELPRLQALRRELHSNPQLAYLETHASALICSEMDRLSIPYQSGLAETGIVAWLVPDNPRRSSLPATAFRADMDALPICESTGLPYASRNEGVMHACGHDGHTTILLGLAAVLAPLRNHLPRPIKFIFQPAEEQEAGALRMIEAGALSDQLGGVPIGRLFGFHNWPDLELGRFAIKRGAFFASADLFRLVIEGRGGHGAMPHLSRDPILTAAHIVCALQSVVSRNLDPVRPGVISVGSIHSGTAENIIPSRAVVEGTIRAMDEQSRDLLHQRIAEVASGIAAGMGVRSETTLERGYPVLVNHPECTEFLIEKGRRLLGEDRLKILLDPVLGAEDFAFYGEHVPTAYFLFGLRGTGEETRPGLHTAEYDFNDDALGHVLRFITAFALDGS
jgi:amidohydrolase